MAVKTLYEEFSEELNGRNLMAGPGTHVNMVRHEESIGVFYHSTEIVKAFPNGRVMLDNGGFKTVTTSKFMKRYLPDGWDVKSWTWLVAPDGEQFSYENGMSIWPNGIADAPVSYAWGSEPKLTVEAEMEAKYAKQVAS